MLIKVLYFSSKFIFELILYFKGLLMTVFIVYVYIDNKNIAKKWKQMSLIDMV